MQLIAAVDRRWAIGRGDKLLFSIPEDLSRFKELTWGHAVICGRVTLSTFPQGKPLPGRRNLVLTHAPDLLPQGTEAVRSVDELFSLLEEESFVVGGASVYAQLLSRCSTAWITQVDADGEGDKFCPDLDKASDWKLDETGLWRTYGDLRYRFCCYKRCEKAL